MKKRLFFGLFTVGVVTFLYLLTTHEALVYMANRYAKQYDLSYKSINGDIFSFVKIEGLKYKKRRLLGSIYLKYSLKELFDKRVKIKKIVLRDPDIDTVLKFIKSLKSGKKESKIYPFKIDTIMISSLNFKQKSFEIKDASIMIKDLLLKDGTLLFGVKRAVFVLGYRKKVVKCDVNSTVFYDIKEKKLRYKADVKPLDFKGFDKRFVELLKGDTVKIEGDKNSIKATLKSDLLSLKYLSKDVFRSAKIELKSNLVNADTNVTFADKTASFYITLPKKSFPKVKKLFPIKAIAKMNRENLDIDITSRLFKSQIGLNLKNKNLYLSSKKLKLKAHIHKLSKGYKFQISIRSIATFYKTLKPLGVPPFAKSDGSVDLEGLYKDGILTSHLAIPHFIHRYSKTKNFIIKDGSFYLSFKDDILIMQRYTFESYLFGKYVKFSQNKKKSQIDFKRRSFDISLVSDFFQANIKGDVKRNILDTLLLIKPLERYKNIMINKIDILSKYDLQKRVLKAKILSEIKTQYTKMSLKSNLKYLYGKSPLFKGEVTFGRFKNLDKRVLGLLENSSMSFEGGSDGVVAQFESRFIKASAKTKYDFNDIKLEADIKSLKLKDFVKDLDKKFEKVRFETKFNTTLHPRDINSTAVAYQIKSNLVNITGQLNIKDMTALSTITLPKNSLLYGLSKKFHPNLLFPLKVSLKKEPSIINISAKNSKSNLTCIYYLSKKSFDMKLKGYGFLLFVKGDMKKYDYTLDMNSLRESLADIKGIYDFKPLRVDAMLSVKGGYKDKKYDFTLDSPWFLYRISFLKYFFIKNSKFSFSYQDKILKLKNYATSAYILDNYRKIYSNRLSTFSFTQNGVKLLFNINNSVNISGILGKKDQVSIKSKSFHIKEPEADVKCKVDLIYNKDSFNSSLEGKIDLLGGIVKYKPKKSYQINDKDIVFVDRISKKVKKTDKMKILINIVADKKLLYEDGKNHIFFKNDISFFRYKGEKLGVYGYVKVLGGVYYSDRKKFRIGEGRLIFDKDYLDPYLNLKAFYKKDPYLITIRIGGRLGSPVINFSSDPYLSQNDILSLLIFNSTVSSLTSGKNISTNQALTLFGNSFAKGVTDSLGINLERIQLLTTKMGRFGFVVEKKLSKRVSIVYQNNIVQSIKIRYKNSKHFETDVTYSPSSSGIEFLYK